MTRRTSRQRDEDRARIERLTESEEWAAVVRSLRERQYLHALTLTVSVPDDPENAFALLHRQQALIQDMAEFIADPVSYLVPDMPDEEQEED